MSGDFVHLHNHTEYSVLDGAAQVSKLVERVASQGMEACAITDHAALFGALDFYETAKKTGVKPIIGCELYLAKGARTDHTARTAGEAYNHLLLLCKDETGYHNLCRLSAIGYLEGFRFKPRVDLDALARHSEGLICASACLAGEIPQFLLHDDMDGADAAVKRYLEIFGRDDFYIEVMDHGMPEEARVNPRLFELAAHNGVKVFASNDCHYVDPEDARAHEALLCIQTNSQLTDEGRFQFPSDAFYVRSPQEMTSLFSEHLEALANTLEVAERCNFDLPLGKHLIPSFTPPAGFDDKAGYLRQLVVEGLEDRFDGTPPEDYVERADYELDVIRQMGFVDYFLVVWDLVNTAREMNIPVGPGRGSGAGSCVAWALKITNIDPIRYKLLFERFLNPERVSMPDFDLDFCYVQRERLIDYVRQKYGEENVAQIITFGRMKAKQAVRNVGRIMGLPYDQVDRLAKLIPEGPKVKLESSMEAEPALKKMVSEDKQLQELWELARRLEGTIGSCGTHAAGVVICDEPLTEHVGLFKASGSDVVATQFEMKGVEEVGLLKMDFLGLRTLTVVHDAVRFVRENRGVEIDIDYLEPDDPKTYALLRSGDTTGVFQLESSGMRDLSRRIGLESLEEICALVALYRPGPMQLKDQYIECKHEPGKIAYDHELLEPILSETYGVALYQEQVMQIVQAVAGFSLGQADILRRAMGKKKVDLMAEQKARFLEGAAANGIDAKTAELLFSRIETFAGYGFNKSHSMAYAFVAYQTAFLKANYPTEFMAALLTSESGNLTKVALYIEEARRMGIDVLPPDVNGSFSDFTVQGDAVRFGLTAIKNVGEGPAAVIVREREANGPFKDIYDFCARIDSREVNRRTIESLNQAGAFLSTGWNRAEVDAALEQALSEGQLAQRERAAGQASLLEFMGDGAGGGADHAPPGLEEWSEPEILANEKEMLGLFVSSHPLHKHRDVIDRFCTPELALLDEFQENSSVTAGGLITAVKHYTSPRNNKKMAFLSLDTLQGPLEVTVFNDVFEKKGRLLEPDAIALFPAKVTTRNERKGLIAQDVVPIEQAEETLAREAHIKLRAEAADVTTVERLAGVLGQAEGPCDVYLHCQTPEDGEVMVLASSACRVKPTPSLREQVSALLGEGALYFTGARGNGLPA